MTALEAAGERAGEKLRDTMQGLGRAAREAAAVLARATAIQRTGALNRAADAIRAARDAIAEANRRDLQAARDKSLSPAMTDRLMLDDQRITAMANGVAEVASLPDPVGTVLAAWTRPNGLRIERVRVPLGVIGIIYESRPNVTADAGGLCIRSGNAVILRGGSESFHSSRAIVAAIETGLERAGLPRAAVQLVPTTDRAAVGHMLAMNELIDVIVPRGGRSLIERVQT
ncbi:MAG: aldehyde dehydrogenase family protein, partial [Stellaceae bacterium]